MKYGCSIDIPLELVEHSREQRLLAGMILDRIEVDISVEKDLAPIKAILNHRSDLEEIMQPLCIKCIGKQKDQKFSGVLHGIRHEILFSVGFGLLTCIWDLEPAEGVTT